MYDTLLVTVLYIVAVSNYEQEQHSYGQNVGETTLEASEDVEKLHSKRVKMSRSYTRSE
jgi:hypothetical protein